MTHEEKVKRAKDRIKQVTAATDETYWRPWWKYLRRRIKRFIKKLLR